MNMAHKKNYVKCVTDHINDIHRDYNVKECRKITAQEIKDFHAQMLIKSNEIFDMIKSFNWLISSDGMQYHPSSKVGCYDDCSTLTQKRQLMVQATSVSNASESTAGWVVNITNKFDEMKK